MKRPDNSQLEERIRTAALKQPQRFLGPLPLLIATILVTTNCWLGYDMVIPGLPAIVSEYACSTSVANLTLFGFLIAMAFGQLFSGTISDQFGRKSVSLCGGVLYLVSNIACVLSPSIEVLVLARIFNGLGGGILLTLMSTIVSDSFDGPAFDRAMTSLQAMVVIGPIAAPFIGSLMMVLLDWRGIFLVLTALSVVNMLCVLVISETLPAQYRVSARFLAMFRSMGVVAREPGFLPTTGIVSIVGMSMMAILAVSAYIYMQEFGLGYLHFSIVYTISAGVGLITPFLYLRISKVVGQVSIALGGLLLMLIGSLLIAIFGAYSALAFFLTSLPVFMVEAVWRSQGYVALLENRIVSRGAANSVANFIYNIICSFGTVLASLAWGSYVMGIAVICVTCSVIALALWFWMVRTDTLLAKYR